MGIKRKRSRSISTPLILGANKEKLNKDDVLKAIESIDVLSKKKEKKDLFQTIEGEKMHLQIAGIKLPKDSRQQLVRLTLPHKFSKDTLLFVKDLEKGIRPDHEPTLNHFNDLLKEKGVEGLSSVMSLRELKVEYKTFETKTALCHKFDKFLADSRIIRFLPKFLGKAFIKRKKFPVSVDMEAKDLKKEIDRAERTVVLPLSHRGTCSKVTIGCTSMDAEQIAENVISATESIARKYPGGWKNIRSIHLKSDTTLSIPLHVSTVSVKDVGFVDANIPEKIKRKTVTDELSTIPGAQVTVTPFGEVKVTKTEDFDWFKMLNSDDDDDEEDQDEEDDEEEKEKKIKERKKKGAKSNSAKVDKSSKSKKRVREDSESYDADSKRARQDDSDSEDENLEKAELDFMKKMAREEEEMEKKSEEPFDDQQNLDENDIVGDDDDDDDEEDDDNDDDLVLKTNFDVNEESEEEEETSKPKMKRKTKKEKRKELKLQKEKAKNASKKTTATTTLTTTKKKKGGGFVQKQRKVANKNVKSRK